VGSSEWQGATEEGDWEFCSSIDLLLRKIQADISVTPTFLRSGTVRKIDIRTSYAPCRNSTKLSVTVFKECTLLSTLAFLVRVVPSTSLT